MIDIFDILILCAIVLALVAYINPKKKVSNDKFDLDWIEQDKINKENK